MNDTKTSEESKATILKLVEAYWRKGDGAALQLFSDDFVDHTAPAGAPKAGEGYRQFIRSVRDAFDGVEMDLDQLVAEGDRVAWRWVFRGKHTRPLMGMPASGRSISFSGITIDRIQKGKIIERWGEQDFAGFMQQLSAPAVG